jgi:hypothetical protein
MRPPQVGAVQSFPSYFHEGDFLRVQSFPPLEDLHPERFSRVAGVVAGPRLVVSTDVGTVFQPNVTTSPGLLMTYMGGTFDTLAAINVDHVGGFLTKGPPGAIEMIRPYSQPFSPSAVWGISAKGSAVVVVDRSEYSNGPASLSVVRLTAWGDTLSATRFDYMPIPIPESVIDSTLARIVGGGFTENDVRESAFLPTAYPPVSDVLLDEDGTTWISRERIPGHPRLWQVVSEEGVILAQVRAPIGFELRSVGWQAVWGLVLDELDVPYLVKRPILRKSVQSPSNQGGGR